MELQPKFTIFANLFGLGVRGAATNLPQKTQGNSSFDLATSSSSA